ncbi:MAG: hypothetical protein ACR2PF_17860 [Rhizobiaceae bacterium]
MIKDKGLGELNNLPPGCCIAISRQAMACLIRTGLLLAHLGLLAAVPVKAASAEASFGPVAEGFAILKLYKDHKQVRRIISVLNSRIQGAGSASAVHRQIIRAGHAKFVAPIHANLSKRFYVVRVSGKNLAISKIYAKSRIRALANHIASRKDLDEVLAVFMSKLDVPERIVIRFTMLGKSESDLVRKDGYKFMLKVLKRKTRRIIASDG